MKEPRKISMNDATEKHSKEPKKIPMPALELYDDFGYIMTIETTTNNENIEKCD